MDYSLKIGILPIRRYISEPPKRIGIFQSDYAVENKRELVPYIEKTFGDGQTSFVDIDFLNEEGLLYLDEDCERVIEYFKAQKIDALFILNCNFGNEFVAGTVARALRLPTLLFGPRDTHFENSIRYTDTQCGLFAISKQLKRGGVPFEYIENCDVRDDKFAKGVHEFLSVSSMVKNFNNLNIVQIGTRIKPFKSIMYNELELCERFGVNIVSVNLAETIRDFGKILQEKGDKLKNDVKELKKVWDTGTIPDETLEKMMAFVEYFKGVAEQYRTDLISTECWTGMPIATGAHPCLAMSLLADMGVYVTCEWDMHGAITNALLLAAARGKGKPLFGEFTTRHPSDDNVELLWHCGPFPLSYKADDGKKPYFYAMKPSFRVRDGLYTIARFQSDGDKYKLLGGKFRTAEGPETFGTYMWAKFDDLPAIERKIIEGPYIHHMSEIDGDYVSALKNFCKYVDGLEFDPLYEEK